MVEVSFLLPCRDSSVDDGLPGSGRLRDLFGDVFVNIVPVLATRVLSDSIFFWSAYVRSVRWEIPRRGDAFDPETYREPFVIKASKRKSFPNEDFTKMRRDL